MKARSSVVVYLPKAFSTRTSESVAEPVRFRRTELERLRPASKFSMPPRRALEPMRELLGVPESMTTRIGARWDTGRYSRSRVSAAYELTSVCTPRLSTTPPSTRCWNCGKPWSSSRAQRDRLENRGNRRTGSDGVGEGIAIEIGIDLVEITVVEKKWQAALHVGAVDQEAGAIGAEVGESHSAAVAGEEMGFEFLGKHIAAIDGADQQPDEIPGQENFVDDRGFEFSSELFLNLLRIPVGIGA